MWLRRSLPALAGGSASPGDGVVKLRSNTQAIDTARGRVENRTEVVVAGTSVVINVNGTVAPAGANRLAVTFTEFDVAFGGGFKVVVPLELLSPKGAITTTFLDEEVRIARGDKGSLFVTAAAPKGV